jgi:hypothetical protein
MARYKEKSEAIRLRKMGYSYSQIKEKLKISKSTLSGWLQSYPLTEKRIRELRDNNPKRIERYINTMKQKREAKFKLSFDKASKDIGTLSERELFIAGFFLYWAEGGKTRRSTLVFTNTDPSMLRVYIRWLKLLGVSMNLLKIKLNIYKDMSIEKEINFWSNELGVKKGNFYKTSIKDSKMSDLSYSNNFGHGTCNIVLNNTILAMYVLMGIKFIGNVVGSRK